MATPKPFQINIPEAVIKNIQSKVADYNWHYMPDDGGWEYGTNLDYMKELCAYWVEEYDWRVHEAQLNKFSHFLTPIDDINIHFIYEKGSGSKPMPLLISHGWPGSVLEFKDIIKPLAHPELFGGKESDAFDVIVPSLPGFGFSGRPSRPMGPRNMASILSQLMTEKLGYTSYIAQGGDWGGAITSWIGLDHAPPCQAIHLNVLTMRHPDGPQGLEETTWAVKFKEDQIMENGYRTIQATKPQTLSYAMNDSPVGIAAWIIEKFISWSDTEDKDLNNIFSKDELLTHVMVYLVTGTFNSASWIYFGRREEGGRILSKTGSRVEVPTGCALFPEEMLSWAPRSYVERIYNVTHWTEMPRGGHFGAMEEPELLIEDIRKFARTLR